MPHTRKGGQKKSGHALFLGEQEAWQNGGRKTVTASNSCFQWRGIGSRDGGRGASVAILI